MLPNNHLDVMIKELEEQILKSRKAFDKGMQENMSFEDLRKLHAEIKDLEKKKVFYSEERRINAGP